MDEGKGKERERKGGKTRKQNAEAEFEGIQDTRGRAVKSLLCPRARIEMLFKFPRLALKAACM